MRTFLILAGLFFFLHSSWAPTWGAPLANWSLLITALGFFGGMASKASGPHYENRIYNNDYYDQQHH